MNQNSFLHRLKIENESGKKGRRLFQQDNYRFVFIWKFLLLSDWLKQRTISSTHEPRWYLILIIELIKY